MAKHTIGRWPVVVSVLKRIDSVGTMGREVRCKNRLLGAVWKRAFHVRNRLDWRAEHHRNGAITYHRIMTDAIADLVRTETQFPTQEYR